MTWLIRLLLFLLLLILVRSLIARLFSVGNQRRPRPSTRSAKTNRTIEGHMVKDPQCGMYVATDLAITVNRSSRRQFCRERPPQPDAQP